MIETVFGQGNDLDAAQMAARAFVMFFIALVLVRIAGMRAFGHKSAFDTIVVIMLGAVMSRAIAGVSPVVPTVAASAMLVVIHRVLGTLGVRHPRLERLIKGSELVLYANGRFDDRAMLRAGISRRDVDAAVRQCGHDTLDDVQTVYKEVNGKLSVISCSSTTRRSQLERHADRRA